MARNRHSINRNGNNRGVCVRPYDSPFTLNNIMAKWDAAMRSIHMAKVKLGVDDTTLAQESINSAGHDLSSTIEYAIKHHIYNNWNIVERHKLSKGHDGVDHYNNFKLPRAIYDLYQDTNGTNGILYSKKLNGAVCNADFVYLATSRDSFSNNTSHKAKDLKLEDVEEAALRIGEYLNTYITPEKLKEPKDFDEKSGEASNFYERVDGFQDRNTVYLLINDSAQKAYNSVKSITRVNWSAIIDFDSNTFDNGHLGDGYGMKNLRKIIKTGDINPTTRLVYQAHNPIFYMADGYAGIINQAISLDNWKRTKQKSLDSFIALFAKDIISGGNQKLVVLSLHPNPQYNNIILNQISNHCTMVPVIEYYVVDEKLKSWVESGGNDNCYYLDFSLGDLNRLLLDNLTDFPSDNNSYELPYRKDDADATGIIPIDKVRSYSDYLDVLYIRNNYEADSADERKKFYIGEMALTWAGAYNHWAVERKWLENLKKIIRGWMENTPYSGPKVCRILHYPGSGGSTLVRQAAFELHKDFPIVFIKKYRLHVVANLLEDLYDYLKIPLTVFVEVPEVMVAGELKNLSSSLNNTKRIILVGISRKSMSESSPQDPLIQECPDWGADFNLIIDKYIKLSQEYGLKNNDEILRRRIADYCTNRHKTPFEVGLTVFDSNYKGISSFVKKFYEEYVNNQGVKTTLCVLALLDIFNFPWIPDSPFRYFFKIPSNEVFYVKNKMSKESWESLIKTKDDQGPSLLSIKHPLLSKEILRQFRGMDEDNDSFKTKLLSLTTEFIKMCAMSGDPFYEERVTELCIDRDEESTSDFAPVVERMPDPDKIQLFRALVDNFPNNPHFHAHLARALVKISGEFIEGMKFMEMAIDLAEVDDFILYHMKGECIRNMLSRVSARSNREDVGELTGWSLERMVEEAGEAYRKTRENQYEINKISLYGYEGHISLLIKALEYVKKTSETDTWKTILTTSPYSDWFEEANSLLDEIRIIGMTDESFRESYPHHLVSIQKILGNYSSALEYLDNQLQTRGSDSIRRLLVGCHLSRPQVESKKYYRTDFKLNERLRNLMQENLSSPRPQYSDFYKWLELARYSNASIEECAGLIANWSTKINHPVVYFYAYVFHTLLALGGNLIGIDEANNYLTKCQELRNRNTLIREWISSQGQIMKGSLLNSRESDQSDRKIFEGTVSRYRHDGEAEVVISNSDIRQRIVFVPKREKLNENCNNKKVTFNLGVSYDGLRAENVRLVKA